MQKWREWEAASEADWGHALKREAVIRPLAEMKRLTSAAVKQAVDRLGLGRTSIYDLVRRYRQRPQTSSLLPWKRGRGPNTHFLDREREDLIADCIQKFYLTPERPSPSALLREIRRRFAERRIPAPN